MMGWHQSRVTLRLRNNDCISGLGRFVCGHQELEHARLKVLKVQRRALHIAV